VSAATTNAANAADSCSTAAGTPAQALLPVIWALTNALTVPVAMNAALAKLWVANSVAVILREIRGQSYNVLDIPLLDQG
jgi:hypothetical protein